MVELSQMPNTPADLGQEWRIVPIATSLSNGVQNQLDSINYTEGSGLFLVSAHPPHGLWSINFRIYKRTK